MNNYELIRTAAGCIAVIVDQDDECKRLFIKVSGLKVLDRVLDTPNIPVQTSICKVIWALVQQEQVAIKLVQDGMMGKIVRLMFLDDPPVQCEAAGIHIYRQKKNRRRGRRRETVYRQGERQGETQGERQGERERHTQRGGGARKRQRQGQKQRQCMYTCMNTCI